jgi:hypothetical protein
MSESRYVSPEQRAAWLIDKGIETWQRIQRLAMSEREPLDSVVLLGQELWMPHHETDGRKFRVTLRVTVHYPEQECDVAEGHVRACFEELEAQLSDERGSVCIAAEER